MSAFRAALASLRALPLAAFWRMIGVMLRAAPRESALVFGVNLLTGATTPLLLWLGKLVIDDVARLSTTRPADPLAAIAGSPVLFAALIGFVAIHIIGDALDSIGSFQFSALRDRLELTVKELVYTKISSFEDLAPFESPELLNIKQLAEQGLNRVRGLAMGLTNMAIGVGAAVPVLILSLSVAWWAPILIFLAAIPTILVNSHYVNRAWGIEQAQAGVVRRLQIYEEVLTAPTYAKELRLFALQPVFLGAWRETFGAALAELRAVRRRGTIAAIGASLVSGIGTTLPYLFVVQAALSRRFSLGDLALYAGLMFEARSILYKVIFNGSIVREAAVGADAIFRLLDLPPTLVTRPAAPRITDAPAGILVRDLRFSYPGSTMPALDGVTLQIHPGEFVVVVGKNGAGKTTLGKLLCRLYDPQAGTIAWDGVDLCGCEPAALRRRIAVVAQDYARFPATLADNIGFGQLARREDRAAITAAAGQVGLVPLAEALPHGFDTLLNKQFEDGTELSGGQWQRVALARAALRQPTTELLILDEPTAALDPKIEHEIYGLLRELAQGRMALVISHRLALARLADRPPCAMSRGV